MNIIIINKSIHHGSTQKIAECIGSVLGADIISPDDFKLSDIVDYDLFGFGSGIYDGKHHVSILELANALPTLKGKKAFLFSTCGVMWEYPKFHQELKNILLSKEIDVLDEFSCKGFNSNSFLKFFGGMNKGRPNDKDLNQAKLFAEKLLTK